MHPLYEHWNTSGQMNEKGIFKSTATVNGLASSLFRMLLPPRQTLVSRSTLSDVGVLGQDCLLTPIPDMNPIQTSIAYKHGVSLCV